MIRTMKRKWGFMVRLLMLLCFFLITTGEGMAAEGFSLPTAEEVSVPTIEELTQGKVKVGDTITKENVDLVKDLISESMYMLVKQGMVMEISKSPSVGELVPQYFKDLTEEAHKNYGQPVIDENMIIYTKDGKPWPYGLPFPRPSNVNEIMANSKYGEVTADYWAAISKGFVNKAGDMYKRQEVFGTIVYANTREKPPLGTFPGYEKELRRFVTGLLSPRDLRGTGQFITRYYDEIKNPETGFVYLPSFKKIVRFSATRYQENIGGGDQIWGDLEGFFEPCAHYNFKLLGTKPILAPLPTESRPFKTPDGKNYVPDRFSGGMKFLRDVYGIVPHYVIEAIPKIKHIYSKRILYMETTADWRGVAHYSYIDIFDVQHRLWKACVTGRIIAKGQDGERFDVQGMSAFYDLQTGHGTLSSQDNYRFNEGVDPKEFSIKRLIEAGR